MLLIILVFAHILAAIDPSKNALALHLAVYPLAVVNAPVSPRVLADPVQVVVDELALKTTLVGPDELALATLFALFVFSCVHRAIRPLFDSLPVLLVVLPLSLVPVPVEMLVDAVPVRLVILPHALVHVSFGVDEAAVTILATVPPVSVVPATVCPYLHPASAGHLKLTVPLSLIDVSITYIAEMAHDKRMN